MTTRGQSRMSRRRLMLGAAVGATSLAASGCSGRSGELAAIDPVAAGLWLAQQSPGYFTAPEDGISGWAGRSEGGRGALELANRIGHAWVRRGREALPQSPGPERYTKAIAAVRSATVNQLEFDFHQGSSGLAQFADRYQPDFLAGFFARLVRGLTNCDGQNHMLALLLGDVERAVLAGVPSGHKLVRLDDLFAGQCFVDAWSNRVPFVLDKTPLRTLPSLAEARAEGRVVVKGQVADPLLELGEYRESGGVELPLPPEVSTGTAVPSEPDLQADALAQRSTETLYAFARVLQLFDDPRAGSVYEALLARDEDSPYLVAARMHAARMIIAPGS